MEREVGGGIRMGNTGKPMDVSFQCMTKSTTIKIIIIKRKKSEKKNKGWSEEVKFNQKKSIKKIHV